MYLAKNVPIYRVCFCFKKPGGMFLLLKAFLYSSTIKWRGSRG
jgi:hypothetical protein